MSDFFVSIRNERFKSNSTVAENVERTKVSINLKIGQNMLYIKLMY